MSLLGYLLSLLLTGIIVGSLGRLALPGPDPMSIGATIVVGIGGAILGSIVVAPFDIGVFPVLVAQVAAATLLVYVLRRRRARST